MPADKSSDDATIPAAEQPAADDNHGTAVIAGVDWITESKEE